MAVCTQCGHELGVGRFCVNCGHPIDAPPTGTATDSEVGTDTGSFRHVGPRPPRRTSRLPWVASALLLLLLAGGGLWLLLSGDDEPPSSASGTPTTSAPTSQRPSPSPSASDEPTDPPTTPRETVNVARDATVTVPATAPPNEDFEGDTVRYDGRNLLDGVPETCWRMPGDGSGESLVLELAGPTTLTSVGLVNGYAKTAQDGGTSYDWYAGNRRVLAVEWVFDDGTVVSQDLGETRAVQSIDLEPVTTSSVRLRLVTVSAPGDGPSARNYTAISEISLVGSPA